jgi:hypothetical protein
VKGWTNLNGLRELTRTEIQDANDWLDALEEAEDAAQAKSEANRKSGS